MYDLDAYRRFAENLPQALKARNIKRMSLAQVGKLARQHGQRTTHGSWGWRSMISSRIAPKTVYLGSEKVRLHKTSELQQKIISEAPEELHKVMHLLRTLPFVHLRRRMGDNPVYSPTCNLYVSVADPRNVRLPYMWGNTMFEPGARNRKGPEFTMIHIPDEHAIRQQVLTIPEHNLNICLGSDYMGEDKKGFLRQAMWGADERGMLGLHAGTKLVTVKDPKDGKMKKIGCFLFGLSATGKSTWSCHQLGFDLDAGEVTEVAQDDIVFLKDDGSAFGSENGFFVKTDVTREMQEAMYWSLIDKTALYENVMIDANGKPDFMDESLCGNGRAVIRKDKLAVRHRGRMKSIEAPSVDLPPLDELDGIFFAFITRRNTIMNFAQELTPKQAVLAYLWGESTHSYASTPAKAGESVRIVGTDPFIVGSQGVKVNRFRDIIMKLVDRFGDKVRFFQYNTGGMGEIIHVSEENGKKVKKMVRKTGRVPIPLMAAIQRGDFRGTNVYEPGILGTREIKECVGGDVSPWQASKFYGNSEIQDYLEELVEGRRAYTQQITEEGLDAEVQRWAEESFEISRPGRVQPKAEPKSFSFSVKEESEAFWGDVDETYSPIKVETKRRLPRSFGE